MDKLFIGTKIFDDLAELELRNFLLLADPALAQIFQQRFPTAYVFDVRKHHFNPLEGMDYKRARDFADLLYNISPQGENTLTVRGGRRALVRLLEDGHYHYLTDLPSPQDVTDPNEKEALGMVEELLFSPTLKQILCKPKNIAFPANRKIIAVLDRAELGNFDALVLGNLLIAQYQGQIVVQDGGFYLRPAHDDLIQQHRLIAGIQRLADVSDKLAPILLSIPDKQGHGCTWDDALTLARYARIQPDTNRHTTFVDSVMA